MMKVVLHSLLGLFVNLVCVFCGSIYTSIHWNPQNPFFTTKSRNCSSGYMTLKVQLHSKIYFMCPNTATVLKETSTAPQTATLYENLWIVRNRMVFDECDTSLETGNKSSNFFFPCNTPTSLKYLLVVFTEFTADPNEPKFEGGKKYYFIGTSDGTQTHINDTKGGHCNDTQKGIVMKIEVYVCKESNLTYTDPLCENDDDVGVLKCPDPPKSPTSTTVMQTTTASMSSTVTVAPTTSTQSTQTTPTTQEPDTVTPGHTTGRVERTSSERSAPQKAGPEHLGLTGDDSLKKELEVWRGIAIAFILICALLVVIKVFLLYRYTRKKESRQVRHSSVEKNPAVRQESVGGVSNRGFIPSLIFKNGGDFDKVVASPNNFAVFYEAPPDNGSTGSVEVDGSKPALDGSIVIPNKEVHFENNEKN